MDFLYQFNLGLIAPLFTGSFHEMFEFFIFFQKFAGLWLVGKVDNHVAIYGSKVAEGFSAFQRRLVQEWDNAGSWDTCPYKTRTYL